MIEKASTRCPVCTSKKFILKEENVTDVVRENVSISVNIFQCARCGLAVPDKMADASQLLEYYEGYYTKITERIDARARLFSIMLPLYKKWCSTTEGNTKTKSCLMRGVFHFPLFGFWIRRSIRFLPQGFVNDRKALLDVGCGNGAFLLRMKMLGVDALGIDFDPNAVLQATYRGLKASTSNMASMKSDNFDYVTLSHVLEHVQDFEDLLNQIFRVLTPGGRLFLATPNYESAGRVVFGRCWKGMDMPRHTQIFTPLSLEQTLLRVGFTEPHYYKDLLQSITVTKSSLKISGKGVINFKAIFSVIKNGFFRMKNQEVIVCTVSKPL